MTTPALPRFHLAGDALARCEQAVRDSEHAGAGRAGSLFPGIGADWAAPTPPAARAQPHSREMALWGGSARCLFEDRGERQGREIDQPADD